MSAYREYLAGLAALAAEDRADPLVAAIRARLRNETTAVAGLVPPPLDRDEPDQAAVLLHLYRTLDGNEPARRRLRRAVVELVSDAFGAAEPLEYIDRLGGLVGFYQVRDDPELAAGLRERLWGHLEGGLARPLEQLMSLDGEPLERAVRAVDLWVSVVPPLAAVPDHHRERLERLFDTWRLSLGNPWTVTATRFHAVLLLFRALLKLEPRETGRLHLRRMAQEVDNLPPREEDLRRRWLALCWEIGILLKRRSKWRRELCQGVRRMDPDKEPSELLRVSLRHMDGLDTELKTNRAGRGDEARLTKRRPVLPGVAINQLKHSLVAKARGAGFGNKPLPTVRRPILEGVSN